MPTCHKAFEIGKKDISVTGVVDEQSDAVVVDLIKTKKKRKIKHKKIPLSGQSHTHTDPFLESDSSLNILKDTKDICESEGENQRGEALQEVHDEHMIVEPL